MQIEFVETFLDLMETRSFNRTAERLGLKQSTVSSRIAVLEEMLEARLFERSRSGTVPTPAGERFVEYARALRHEWHHARRAVGERGAALGALRIGLQNDLAATHIGEWVGEIRNALPGRSFYFELDYSNQMCLDLMRGDLDVAVLYTPRAIPDLHLEIVGEVAYRMVSTEAHAIGEIVPQRYVLAGFSPHFERVHRERFPDLSAASLSTGQNVAVCGLLGALGGTAFVLEESARAFVETGLYHYVADAGPIVQPVYFGVNTRNRHTHACRRIAEIVRRRFSDRG